ncbi:uncharacterized protein LOC132727489 [Ruditapes philippinarum]|uniref:uncharacterized protein LOC132727489 n=1 Tax=Ruditapes philippinarum TaxID=129788 RepID=UPI00295A62A7|nr:uncharacterized protein LOC132727489 [Ruditapes philippinarum]
MFSRYLCLAFLFFGAHAQLNPGSVSGGSSTSGSSIGSTGGFPFPPMVPHAPNAIHHVGVSYNLLKGNPDGQYWSTGGEDVGVSLTKKIFTISPGDHPPEIISEHHDGCQYSHGFTLFYNPKSYQDKLLTTVKTSGTADSALKPFAFTLSSAYQAVVTQTSKHHYIYQDAATYCKLGHVRYSMKLAESDHYPVTREFAADVCSLPVTYDANSYMQFIEKWGTHVVTEVDIGKATTNRYVGRLRDLFNFVMFNVTDEISMGGTLDGFPSSYVIDPDSYKYRHEYKYIVGVFEDNLSIGDQYYNDVIGKSVQTIDMALDTKYWQFINAYVQQHVCTASAAQNLGVWQTNIVTALKAYPAFKNAMQPAVLPLAMPATWPLGTFSIPKPQGSQCPTTDFMGGTLTLPQGTHTGAAPTGLHIGGQLTSSKYTLQYCTKEDPAPTPYDIYWPRGDYCIQQYDDRCPYAFRMGKVLLKTSGTSAKLGIAPTGTYGTSTELQFCCRNDSVYSHKVYLPSAKPFYLFKFQHGCQKVNGMSVTDETLPLYNDVTSGGSAYQTRLYGSYPYVEEVGRLSAYATKQYNLHYCYYQPITK